VVLFLLTLLERLAPAGFGPSWAAHEEVLVRACRDLTAASVLARTPAGPFPGVAAGPRAALDALLVFGASRASWFVGLAAADRECCLAHTGHPRVAVFDAGGNLANLVAPAGALDVLQVR
jgi:hypothetical protein